MWRAQEELEAPFASQAGSAAPRGRRPLGPSTAGIRIDTIQSAELGNLGDVKPAGKMRIDVGPGYRVYFTLQVPLIYC